MTQVTVALAGDPESPPPGAIDWYAVAWEDLQKVGLTVEDDETLADILDHAAEAFGAPPFGPFERPHRSAFWVAFEDGSGRPLIKRRLAELTLLDEHGEATWGVRDWALVPYGQLRASAAAGLVPGDPTRLYFIRQIPQGDLGIVVENWDVFMRCWDVAWNILEHLATVGEAVGGGVLGWKGLRRAHEAIRRHRPRWEQRGATPANLGAAFGDTADAEELARRLGCSPEEAQIIRSFFDAIDGDDELLTAIHREITNVEPWSRDGFVNYVDLFSERVEALAGQGDRPPPTPVESYRIDSGRWMRETFNLPGIPDDAEVDAEAARLSEEELDLDYDDGDSIFIAIPLAVAWMILLPGFIIGVALNAGWVARLIAAVATTAVVATVVLVGPIRRPLGRAIGRLLPSEE